MADKLAIDDALIEAARKIGHHPTQKAAVIAALEEYIQHRKQLGILDLFGTIDFDPGYDYKANRQLDKIQLD